MQCNYNTAMKHCTWILFITHSISFSSAAIDTNANGKALSEEASFDAGLKLMKDLGIGRRNFMRVDKDKRNTRGRDFLKTNRLSNSECKDDETYIEKGKNCQWMRDTRRGVRIRHCKSPNVSTACPLTCGTCGKTPTKEPINQCPENSSSPEFNKSCTKEGETCGYNHVFTGCSWNSLHCSPQQLYKCSQTEWWKRTSSISNSCTNTPNGLPINEECKPCPKVEPADKCPSDAPVLGSDCSEAGLKCNYNFKYSGCSKEELKCVPTKICFCREKSWVVLKSDLTNCLKIYRPDQ